MAQITTQERARRTFKQLIKKLGGSYKVAAELDICPQSLYDFSNGKKKVLSPSIVLKLIALTNKKGLKVKGSDINPAFKDIENP